MARLQSYSDEGEGNPKLAFGKDILGWRHSREGTSLNVRIYIEAFGSKIVRPPEASYQALDDDIDHLVRWLDDYLLQKVEVLHPYSTMEPVLELRLAPSSGKVTSFFAKLLAYGTVPEYWDDTTGLSVEFDVSNQDLSKFRNELFSEITALRKRDKTA